MIRALFLTFILFFTCWGIALQKPLYAAEVELESLQAAFIQKFTNYIEWPEDHTKDFVIAVLNNEKLYGSLKEAFDGKIVYQKSPKVNHYSKLERNLKAHILYVSHIDHALAQDLKKINSHGLLIITRSTKGLHEKSLVNFYIDEEKKLRFEIDNDRAMIQGFKINSRLLNLSRNSK